MFEIIVMVCLAATGEDCREYKMPDTQFEDAVSCIRESHGKAYDWQSENNKYTVIGTRCAKDAKVPGVPKD
ncbi:hypothetical protein AUC70_01240 [Methyloceanibacter stevinii]|uniref:Uncharacterized protein n=1 Tax=Methyloceanibacter stevinii TaxID=1774970 RepID=A0A1E3VQJ4_9HYPH|nr:hypothetical protein [Methyloceanibacter stevinii]ODR95571.1 hypothetical protein AUC70_01240 [Methyloceanibacter stevinii]